MDKIQDSSGFSGSDREELAPPLGWSALLMPENTLGGLDSCFQFIPTSLSWEPEGLARILPLLLTCLMPLDKFPHSRVSVSSPVDCG